MIFTAEEYFQAGAERMQQARGLFRMGDSYALAMYCGGLAVECTLRAFRWEKDRSFEGRHDLEELLRASDMLGANDSRMRQKGVPEEEIHESTLALRAAIEEVVVLWHNNLRFASEKRLRAVLRGCS
jgi:HEPN domain-containing protein